MERSLLFRRIFHMTAPIYLVYYLLPDVISGISKQLVLMIVFFSIIAFEAVRISRGMVFFGLKEYERKHISAFAWSALGMTLALLLFPMHLAVVGFLGLAFIDPLIGEIFRTKNHWLHPNVPLFAYFAIAFAYLSLVAWYPPHVAATIAAVGSVVAIVSEYPQLRWVNDDFLIMMVPLIAMYLAWMGLLALL